ncbi:hypothetical protein [Archaeoglobus sp.]
MRKILLGLLVLVVVGVASAAAIEHQQSGLPKLEINEDNFEEVKERILSEIEMKISKLQTLKEKVESANSADELKSIMEEHALDRAKEMSLRQIERAIERLEKSNNTDAVSKLESLKEEVSQATSMEELREIMKEVRGILEGAGLSTYANG